MASKAKQAKKAVPRKKGATGYKLPEPIPNGEVLQDYSKKQWRIGPSIGVGGFGEIYSACEHGSTPKKTTLYPYVIKIEPHGNGPLFVEMHFYMRNAKKEDIEAFKKANGLTSLGMPEYLGAGSHEYGGDKYRFVVMQRFGRDLWKQFLDSGRIFPTHTVFKIAIQMIDVLQYIHGRTYVHADIKGGNILIGTMTGVENQAYLVDFGLASHYSIKEFKVDPKKAHDGTIEYTSRDAHNGVPTRRGDMEILAYNLVQWLAGALPWESDLKSPVQVQAQKEKSMADVPAFLRKTFSKIVIPHAITSFVTYVSQMKYDDAPDYKKCKQMFEIGLKTLGYVSKTYFEFTPTRPHGKVAKKKLNASKTVDEPENEMEDDSEAENVLSPAKVKAAKKAVKSKKVLKKAATKTPLVNDKLMKTPTQKLSSASIATQTSLEKPKVTPNKRIKEINASFDAEIVQRSTRTAAKINNYAEQAESDSDVIDNSYTETPAKKAVKRKHTKKVEVEYGSDEEVTIHTTIKKKRSVLVAKDEVKSWKNSPAILNGKPTRAK